MTPDGTIRSIGQTVNRIEDIHAQPIGLLMFKGRGVKALRRAWQRATTDAAYRRPILGHTNAMAKLTIADVLDELVSGEVPVKAVPIHGGWIQIETPQDIAAAEERWNSSSGSVAAATEPVAGVSAPGSAPTLGSAPEPGSPSAGIAPARPATESAPSRNEPFELPPIFRAPRRR
jgi:hypothetical protein